MKRYARSHLSDQVLLRSLGTHLGQERTSTAELLADLAEVDARKLYVPAAHPSMFAYCVGELHLCEQAAFKRICAARAARRFPAILDALAEGRLHLSAVCLLAPHLTEDTAGELLTAATHKSKSQIERLLAERFPRPDIPAFIQPVSAPSLTSSAEPQASGAVDGQLSPGIVAPPLVTGRAGAAPPDAPHLERHLPATGPGENRARVKPLAPHRYAVQFTMSQSAHDKLRHAQELLGHQVPAGDLAQLFERALDALIPQLEKQRFAATSKPRPRRRRESANPRHIPADVQRAVWERDQGRCTYESESGRRCEARTDLEFDHIQEVARGGEATLGEIRLMCRAHNQHQAERTFGVEFMRHKRIAAADARTEAMALRCKGQPGAPASWARPGFRVEHGDSP